MLLTSSTNMTLHYAWSTSLQMSNICIVGVVTLSFMLKQKSKKFNWKASSEHYTQSDTGCLSITTRWLDMLDFMKIATIREEKHEIDINQETLSIIKKKTLPIMNQEKLPIMNQEKLPIIHTLKNNQNHQNKLDQLRSRTTKTV